LTELKLLIHRHTVQLHMEVCQGRAVCTLLQESAQIASEFYGRDLCAP
jgi:hypothetical protein